MAAINRSIDCLPFPRLFCHPDGDSLVRVCGRGQARWIGRGKHGAYSRHLFETDRDIYLQ